MMASLLGYLRTERRQREIRNAFSRYMSPHFVDELARNPEKLSLGGEMRANDDHVLRHPRLHDPISEGMNAQELTQFMNRFLSPMTEIITEHKGTIDKYIGDCIMAFWNAPLDDPDHAKNAVAAAQDMRRKLIELNRNGRPRRPPRAAFTPLQIGIGLNTGECVRRQFRLARSVSIIRCSATRSTLRRGSKASARSTASI